jgi:hypothetical protein
VSGWVGRIQRGFSKVLVTDCYLQLCEIFDILETNTKFYMVVKMELGVTMYG